MHGSSDRLKRKEKEKKTKQRIEDLMQGYQTDKFQNGCSDEDHKLQDKIYYSLRKTLPKLSLQKKASKQANNCLKLSSL